MGSDGQYTEFTYTVEKTGGTSTQQWSFDFDKYFQQTFVRLTDAFTVTYTVGV